jgi:hypothetical protein
MIVGAEPKEFGETLTAVRHESAGMTSTGPEAGSLRARGASLLN